MHVYYLRAIINFYNIKGKKNTKKINQLKVNFIMIFVIKSSSKPYWKFKNSIKLIKNIYISKMNSILRFIFILKLMCFYLNQFLNTLSNLISIIFKRIEANYLYVYQTNFTLKINHMNCFLHFIVMWNLTIQKGKWQPKKTKWYKSTIKLVTQHSYFEKKLNK